MSEAPNLGWDTTSQASTKALLALALGSAFDALVRFKSTEWPARSLGTVTPFGTLFVNLAGSFVTAFVIEFWASGLRPYMELRGFLAVGPLRSHFMIPSFSPEVATPCRRRLLTVARGHPGRRPRIQYLLCSQGFVSRD